MAWMMPLSHSTSDGQLEDLDGPSESPGTRTVSMAWMMPLSHSTSDGQLEDLDGPSALCLSKAELAGARSVYSPPERSMPSLVSAAASWSKLSYPLMSASSWPRSTPSEPQKIS